MKFQATELTKGFQLSKLKNWNFSSNSLLLHAYMLLFCVALKNKQTNKPTHNVSSEYS